MDAILPAYARLRGVAYGPTKHQRAFHSLGCMYRYFRGGLGAGKSLAGSRDTLLKVLSNAEWLTDHNAHSPRPFERGLDYIVGAPSYDLVEAGAWYHINDWLEQFSELNGWSLVDRVWETEPKRIRLRTKDVLRFVSLKHPKGFAGINAAGAWLDEAELGDDPMGAFQALNKRLRNNAIPPELWFLIVTSTNEGYRGVSAHFEAEIARGNTMYGLVKAPTSSNPGVAKSYIDNLSAGMSAREVAELLHGETEPEEGSVFRHEFHRTQNVIPWQWLKRPRKGCEYYVAIDWGGHYHALFIEHYPLDSRDEIDEWGGVDVVFDELVMDGVQDSVFLDAVMERLRSWNLETDKVTAHADYYPRDSVVLANTRRYFGGRCYSQRVGETQFKRAGIRTVRWRLSDANGVRRLFFADRLHKTKENRRILACMDNYAYATKQGDGQLILLPDVKQESVWSHGPDALRAYCFNRYRHLRAHESSDRKGAGGSQDTGAYNRA